MDGFDGETDVIVWRQPARAVLDPTLLSIWTIDRRVNITLPERKDREAILKVHFKKKPTDETVDLDKNWRQEVPLAIWCGLGKYG